jgi:RNA polymerase subunit RPABC4/transcription elongation factor Spt4
MIECRRVPYPVKSCVICGGRDITRKWIDDRCVSISCRACGRIVQVEFDPPDRPGLRGRIEVLFDPDADPTSEDDP